MKDIEDIIVGIIGIIFFFTGLFMQSYNGAILLFTLTPLGFIMLVYGFRRYMGGDTPEDRDKEKLQKQKEVLEVEKLKKEIEELKKEVKK